MISFFKSAKSKKNVAKLAAQLGILTKTDLLSFGKYKGMKVKTVLKNDPGYICWVHDNTTHKFASDIIATAREAQSVILLAQVARSNAMYMLDQDFDALSLGMMEDFH